VPDGCGGLWCARPGRSTEGRPLALGAGNGVFGLWEAATGKETVRLTPAGNDYEKAIASVTFSPDSHYVLAGTWGGTFRCWDTLTGEELASRTAHVGGVRALAFTPDGRTFASAGADTTILLWDFSALIKARP